MARLERQKEKEEVLEVLEKGGLTSSIFAERPAAQSRFTLTEEPFTNEHTETKYMWREETSIIEKSGSTLAEARHSAILARQPVKSPQAVKEMLEGQHINTDAFGTGHARTLDEFYSELWSGASRLMQDAAKFKAMVRVVDIVLLRIIHGEGPEQRCIIKTGETMKDGRMRDANAQLPGSKKEPHENTRQVAERVLTTRMGLGAGDVALHYANSETFEREEESPTYPGVRTVYTIKVVPGRLVATSPETLEKVSIARPDGIFRADRPTGVINYQWMNEADCLAANVKLREPAETQQISALVNPVAGMDPDSLAKFLEECGVDVGEFGIGDKKSIKDLSDELLRGESSLERLDDGTVRRLVKVVALALKLPSKPSVVLAEVQTIRGGRVIELNRLPAKKVRPSENFFLAAQWVMKELKLDQNTVILDPENVRTVESEQASSSYPLPTIYTRHIITGMVVTGG
eukprot:NODE_1075_length_2619_cov_2.510835.p1 GENE.NODE_1075_length_2619_cov_2.510835~~NODE_1075_length_2619_cov_2.510835.p1  ORF type:complete len:461 (-),score=149.75 NODE_1075_length_2619_cov_2.510835:436-1818(-)